MPDVGEIIDTVVTIPTEEEEGSDEDSLFDDEAPLTPDDDEETATWAVEPMRPRYNTRRSKKNSA